MLIFRFLKNNKGDMGILSVLLTTAIIIFVLLPIFTIVFEKFMMHDIGNTVKGALNDSLNSTYVALDIKKSSFNYYDINTFEFRHTFEQYLKENLNLNNDFSPKSNSVADDIVTIKTLDFHGSNDLPYIDPVTNETYVNPFVHVEINLPVKPHLYRKLIMEISGKSTFNFEIIFNGSFPVNE